MVVDGWNTWRHTANMAITCSHAPVWYSRDVTWLRLLLLQLYFYVRTLSTKRPCRPPCNEPMSLSLARLPSLHVSRDIDNNHSTHSLLSLLIVSRSKQVTRLMHCFPLFSPFLRLLSCLRRFAMRRYIINPRWRSSGSVLHWNQSLSLYWNALEYNNNTTVCLCVVCICVVRIVRRSARCQSMISVERRHDRTTFYAE